ncbi:50S ribosomal protein L13 [Candidatus Woesebacteria bacterium RIFCSPHIGHO2_02_FULL_38_9]|uniref:Large ribosomal subunit protein uL13 n=1 Tax=Candidatus Woesebacteria bacterium RIFCSPHIGHO2_01_FULL_39_28 TaxID=1802496 RepID=A0A1F7YA43_9BACT|nr:MAG: 50S ribosomal protein L13 [Candidatus Woesebacteria bacterium RIFCSPHIGHO2_01_FULL_39_28]OGM32225.1 MAG: 50S ribosomal protein L13 [Candidatus Woesebacteria bacterium RIFCSPHIGHO2_02_FULL_38_9]OGM58449.1 MAG: 50S ribosomal protein L13 [Candidatus Woesebacteria bacterium RIFCSPLOWO2_01_FULL_38_20]
MKTFQPRIKEVKRNWHLIDAKGQILGRMASNIALLLMGKGKKEFVPHLDMGDFVVVINARKIMLTGKKEKQKVYYHHSGYPGGFKEVKLATLMKTHPERIIEFAVKGMLPDNRLKKKRLIRLYVFADEKNPYKDKFLRDK